MYPPTNEDAPKPLKRKRYGYESSDEDEDIGDREKEREMFGRRSSSPEPVEKKRLNGFDSRRHTRTCEVMGHVPPSKFFSIALPDVYIKTTPYYRETPGCEDESECWCIAS
ncbi:hypothetical protein C8R41DRAFT_863411 [Lentinula lateritia]|uniref:Uncharacterized protein n=1 Tax=Lentinula lateritia TaxID=40482 RepID=A0ABQ8VUQ1_9AGAR|nr:hypothetical protein C8R41DRAFT_863411 [Lentinula lateritia]